ncbi:MAG TPA: co-chaperone GroES [bacterium]|nr:co-chaperone GroES [bacterium]HOL66887.1 co-chaperone GroES [bacterium]HPP12364.1 co-chaperone GroES [bacterium]
MAKFKIRPLGDRVVVEPLEAEEKSKGGIILPDTAKEKPQEGKIVAVGKGKVDDEGKTVPMEVKVGDKVLYGKYAGTEITVEGKEYMILKEEDILAVVEEK